MKRPHFKFSHFTNLIFWSVLGLVLYQRLPGWIYNHKVEGQPARSFQAYTEQGDTLLLPKPGTKQVLVFWATWCGPCTVELSRLNEAVKDGDINPGDIVAVSLGEEPSVVWAARRERDYRFLTVADPSGVSSEAFSVAGTPQIFHVDGDGSIAHASTGLGLLTVWRAESFLKAK